MGLPEKNNGARLERAWLRWGITIILAAWAFILGILVGQGTLANDQQLASLRRLSLSWFGLSVSQGQQQTQQPLRDLELSFYDELGRPHNRQLNQEAGPTPPEPDHAPSAAGPHPDSVPRPDSVPAVPASSPRPLEETEPPAAPPSPPPARLDQVRPYTPDTLSPASQNSAPPASASTPPSSGSEQTPQGRFTIQVGSFKDEAQARQLTSKLKRNGFPSYISSSQVNNVGLRFRVRVGGYDNLDQAENVAASLRARERVTAFVTRNE